MPNMNECYISPKTGSLITCEGRLSYAQYLFKPNPESKTKDGKPKYTLSFLIPPGSNLDAAKAAVQEAIDNKWPEGSKGRPRNPKLPFLDAAEKMGDEWEGWTLLRLSTTRKPAVVEGNMAAADEADVYSGRWARLSINAGAYETDGNKGASFFLNNVQLLRHDDPIGGSAPKAENEFDAVETSGGLFDAVETSGGLFDAVETSGGLFDKPRHLRNCGFFD